MKKSLWALFPRVTLLVRRVDTEAQNGLQCKSQKSKNWDGGEWRPSAGLGFIGFGPRFQFRLEGLPLWVSSLVSYTKTSVSHMAVSHRLESTNWFHRGP